MATPSPSHDKSADNRERPLVEVPSDNKTVKEAPDRTDGESLNATDSGADTAESTLQSVDSLNEDSDVSAFMSPQTHENLRQMALRKLFHLPKFNRRDGLDDYDDDYRTFKPLGDMMTSDWRHQLERLTQGVATRKRQVPASDATTATAALGANNQSRQYAHPTPGQSGGQADRTPNVAADCVLCRRPTRSVCRTCEWMSCGRWFEQCPSRANADQETAAHIAMGINRPEEMSAVPVHAASPPCDAQDGGLSVTVHAAIKNHIESGDGNPVVVFHDAGLTLHLIKNGLPNLPEAILWFPVSGQGLMLDLLLAAVAWGADRVVVVAGNLTGTVLSGMEDQKTAVEAILDGLGMERERIALVGPTHVDSASLSAVTAIPTVFRKLRPTRFEPVACGRAMIYSALDAVQEQTVAVRPAARLPEGSPFGDVCIDSKACTLCMACVAACPTEALRDGGSVPQIRFQEESCVQCGLCQAACPEKAIRLVPRMVFDRQARRAVRCLNQAEPVGCVVCGRPFAVAAMVDRVAQRLANHWMYQSDAAKRRLRMCSDCRVQDFIRENGRPDQKTPSPDEH